MATENALAAFKAAGLPAHDMSRFKTALAGAAQTARMASVGTPFLRLLKDGEWVYGADDVEVQARSLWAINPFSMAQGFCAWGTQGSAQEGTLLGEKMALITGTYPNASELADVGAAWNEQIQFDLVCLNGDDKGVEVRFKTSSKGGLRAFAGLLQDVSTAADEDGKFVPIVSLESDSYVHKKYGRTYFPVFDVKEWQAPDSTQSEAATQGNGAGGDEEERQPAEPVKRRGRPPAAKAEVEAGAVPSRRRAAVSDAEPEPSRGRAAVVEEQPAEEVSRSPVVRRRRR